jgi:SAM-dependent methyltransferase
MIQRVIRRVRGRLPRVVLDGHLRLGDFENHQVGYDASLCKEEVSRAFILEREGEGLRFLDIGARDGELSYLLGNRGNLHFDAELEARNRARFRAKYEYFGLDLPGGPREGHVIEADVCDPRLTESRPDLLGFFDVIYSNNVFEHLRRPWLAAENILRMLKPGGVCITVVPFSIRYHEVPGDYFRYTHTGVVSLFEDHGPIRVLVSGYDTLGRRNNWQGTGENNDICPVDHFGAWRETWFTVTVLEKL